MFRLGKLAHYGVYSVIDSFELVFNAVIKCIRALYSVLFSLISSSNDFHDLKSVTRLLITENTTAI